MKKRECFILIGILLSLVGDYVMANDAVSKFSKEIEEMNAAQMKEIGVNIEHNSINFIGVRYAKDKEDNISPQYRLFEIKNNRINLKNAKKSEDIEQIALPIRLVVVKSQNKTAAYYHGSTISADKKKIDDKINDIADNNWKAVLYKSENNQEFYLWYDAKDMKTKKIGSNNSASESNSTAPHAPEFITNVKIMPNPCRNSSAKIEFRSDNSQAINIEMYNVSGERVLSLANSQLFNSGLIELPINSDNLADGMYLIVFTSDNGGTISKRFIKANG